MREDRMCLKINGAGAIYGCYSHSSIISTFHRRCYWLLDRPDLVLVHYLQTPDAETAECVINNVNRATQAAAEDGHQMSREDLKSEIKAMLWPYYESASFLVDNSKSLLVSCRSSPVKSVDEFLDLIATHLLTGSEHANASATSGAKNSPLIRINLTAYLNLSTSEILARVAQNTSCCSREGEKSRQQSGLVAALPIPMPMREDTKLKDGGHENRQVERGSECVRFFNDEKVYDDIPRNPVQLSINHCSTNVRNFICFLMIIQYL